MLFLLGKYADLYAAYMGLGVQQKSLLDKSAKLNININFCAFLKQNKCGYSKKTSQKDSYFEHQIQMLKLLCKKY